MCQINSIDDLFNSNIPLPVLKDVSKRIIYWLLGGGKEWDPYIKQQLKYASNFIKEVEHGK